jgi:hypothetical protein
MTVLHPNRAIPVPFGRCTRGPVWLQIGRARGPLTGFTANQYLPGTYWEGIADRKGWPKGAGLNVQKGPILDEGDT